MILEMYPPERALTCATPIINGRHKGGKESRPVSRTGARAPIDIRLTEDGVGWRVDFDQGAGLSKWEYRELKRAVAQLRHSVRGVGRLTIAYDNEACCELAERLGFRRVQGGMNGYLYELEDAHAGY